MDTFNGMPLHPLVVHFVVVLLPLAALLAVLGAVWPAARNKLGIITPIVAVAAAACVPIATSAGESLEESIGKFAPPSEILERHADLGGELIYWAVPLAALSIAWWAVNFPATRGWLRARLPKASRQTVIAGATALRVLLVVFAVGAAIWVYRIGDAGAQATWGR